MAKKITIQHWYTTSGTTAPTGLIEGEIAISHLRGEEAIFIKPDENDNQIKFIPKHQIENLITTRLGEAGVATEGMISALTTNLENHITGDTANVSKLGHVKLVGGDLSGNTGNTINGEAAASHHIHSQYIAKDDISSGLEIWETSYGAKEMLRVKAAANGGIIVDASGVSINNDLKNRWENAADSINAFMSDNASISGAVDTLKEIQQFLDGTGSTVQTLLVNLSDLTDRVSGNTDSISGLSNDVNQLKDESANYIKTLIGDDHIEVTKLSGATQPTALSHKPASTQSSAITATNESNDLNFGDTFELVVNVGYDKNGHVVSGSTRTLKLPTVPEASVSAAGIVKLKSGDLSMQTTNYTDAAAAGHTHSQYVKFADLSNYDSTTPLIISCGTY